MKTYIIPKNSKITPDIKATALSNGCGSVSHGIPPRLAKLFTEADLPAVYEYPAQAPRPPVVVRDIGRDLDILQATLLSKGIITTADLTATKDILDGKPGAI